MGLVVEGVMEKQPAVRWLSGQRRRVSIVGGGLLLLAAVFLWFGIRMFAPGGDGMPGSSRRREGGHRAHRRRATHRRAAVGPALPVSQDAVRRLGLPRSEVEKIQRRWEYFRRGEIVWDWRVGRKITMTFDDGPSPRTTPLLLENLDRQGVQATFFVVGRRIGGHGPIAVKSREILREEARRGYLVGLHSYSHPMMIELSHDKQKREIVATERAVVRTTGLRPYLYRPPFGGRTRYSEGVLRKRGYSVVMWNMSTGDPFVHHPSKVLATAMKKVKKHQGGILLMHDTYGWSAAAAPLIVRAILLESCTVLARGEQPYVMVGLEHFWMPAGADSIPETSRMQDETARWIALTRRVCGVSQDKRRGP